MNANDTQHPVAFDAMLASFDKEIKTLANAARDFILSQHPKTVEVVWPQQKTAGYGTGPHKMSEHFVWLAPATRHVVFGFYYGSELKDPDGRLEGTGKLMRHVKVRSMTDLNQSLKKLLDQAVSHRVPPFR